MSNALLERLENLRERLPSEGRVAGKATSVITRLILLGEFIDETVNKAICLGKTREGCKTENGTEVCITGCAGIYASREEGTLRIWKTRSNVFSAELSTSELRINSEDYTIRANAERLYITIPADGSKETIEIDLRDASSIFNNYQLISYALKNLERLIYKARENLEQCIKSSRIAC